MAYKRAMVRVAYLQGLSTIGFEETEGVLVAPGLAVTQRLDGPDYVVTHIPTGKRMDYSTRETEEEAVAVALALAALPIRWTRVGYPPGKRTRELAMGLLRKLNQQAEPGPPTPQPPPLGDMEYVSCARTS